MPIVQSPNSSVLGFIQPSSTDALDDQALDRVLHDFYMGLTAIDATLIRPRWTIEPANMPDINTNWIAQGITERRDDHNASQEFIDGVGMKVIHNQEFDNLVSFYGPAAYRMQAMVRDGIQLFQNRDYLHDNALNIISVGNARNVAFQVNGKWYMKVDCNIQYRRTITTIYPILSLTSAVQHEQYVGTNYNPTTITHS